MTDFIFLGSKITADDNCNHEIKTLASQKKSYDKSKHHIKKQRHYFTNKGPSSQSYGFSSSHVWMRTKELMLLICDVEEDSWESLGLQGDTTSPFYRKSVLNIHWKDWSWNWNSNTLATLCKELTYFKSPWCWERLKAGGEGDDRGWDGWMASLTRLTWVWVNFSSWWWTGRPGVLQSMELEIVRHNWGTEMNWTAAISFLCMYLENKWKSMLLLFKLTQSCLTLRDSLTATCQASQYFTISRSLLKLMSSASVMPFNYLILCRPLLLLPSTVPSSRVFSNESALHIRWPKYWSFSISPSNLGLISFRTDWFDLLAIQGTLKGLL